MTMTDETTNSGVKVVGATTPDGADSPAQEPKTKARARRNEPERARPSRRAFRLVSVVALLGIVVLGMQNNQLSPAALRTAALVASAFLAVQVGGFYLVQRRGLFSKVMWAVRRFSRKRDWSQWITQAEAIDVAVQETYRRNGPVTASFLLSLLGWVVGTGEVYLIAWFLGTPVSWPVAFVLESLGQAIRGAGFAIPGALGVQEGGYLLLAPLAGLTPDAAVALSLAKRTRELLLGLPGLLYLRLGAGQTAAPGSARP